MIASNELRKYIQTKTRKININKTQNIVTRMEIESFDEDIKDLGNQLQKKMCLQEEEYYFCDENMIVHTDPCEVDEYSEEKFNIIQEVTFNPQSSKQHFQLSDDLYISK